jgi:hypothetical protein
LPNLSDVNKRPSNDDFLTDEEQKGLIDRIDELLQEPNINDWELGFLDTCLKRVQGRRNLTDGQSEKLDTIEIEAPLRLSPDDYGDGPGRCRYWDEDVF